MSAAGDAAQRIVRSWGTVHETVSMTIAAPPERLASLYLDYTGWSRLWPDTIRGVRLIHRDANATMVEVDHRTAGHVLNIIHPHSPTEIELSEMKPKFDATFVNRFERSPKGTRYRVIAVVRLKPPYRVLGPFIHGIVRRMIRRYVLAPMRTFVEREAALGH
jgi:hypothetical protein